MLAEAGCKKLTFVGGEPTLNPYLPTLLRIAKDASLTTMIVTNGTTLDSFLEHNKDYIDWISLSIDSQYEDVEKALGRGDGGHVAQTIANAQRIHDRGMNLKVNTVVTQLNYQEDMSDFMLTLAPHRWKVFQVLKVAGQNEQTVEPLLITNEEFEVFKKNHRYLTSKSLNVVFESNTAMRGSYLMLDPCGRFFTNRNGWHEYTSSIFDVGVEQAVADTMWNSKRFVERGGLYDWRAKSSTQIESKYEVVR